MINVNIYVFSYNRGVFLENSLRSLLLCAAPYSITVVDDESTNNSTRAVLDFYRDKVKIVVPKLEQPGVTQPLGGLYNNMRYAFDDARKRNVPYVLFLQDDMQLVRPITPEDLASAEIFFETNPGSAQLQTCFLKKINRNLDEQQMTEDPSGQAYLRPSNYRGYSGFSDVGLFHVERFFNLFGELRNRESDNNAFAQQNGIQMGLSTRPFMMWLPFPISYRGKRRYFKLRFVEWLGGGGFFPYNQMNEEEVERFLNRGNEVKPFAEDWLKCPRLKLAVWSFAGGYELVKARSGWRKTLGRFVARL